MALLRREEPPAPRGRRPLLRGRRGGEEAPGRSPEELRLRLGRRPDLTSAGSRRTESRCCSFTRKARGTRRCSGSTRRSTPWRSRGGSCSSPPAPGSTLSGRAVPPGSLHTCPGFSHIPSLAVDERKRPALLLGRRRHLRLARRGFRPGPAGHRRHAPVRERGALRPFLARARPVPVERPPGGPFLRRCAFSSQGPLQGARHVPLLQGGDVPGGPADPWGAFRLAFRHGRGEKGTRADHGRARKGGGGGDRGGSGGAEGWSRRRSGRTTCSRREGKGSGSRCGTAARSGSGRTPRRSSGIAGRGGNAGRPLRTGSCISSPAGLPSRGWRFRRSRGFAIATEALDAEFPLGPARGVRLRRQDRRRRPGRTGEGRDAARRNGDRGLGRDASRRAKGETPGEPRPAEMERLNQWWEEIR